MKRRISFIADVSIFKVTLHNVEIILNNRWKFHMDKLNTRKKVTISTTRFKDKEGDIFPFYRRPKTIEIKAKEGSIRIGISEIIYG